MTEASLRADEPDPRVFLREYAAVPQAAKCAAFDGDRVLHAFQRPMPDGILCRPRLILDPSSGKNDPFTAMAIGWVIPEKDGKQFAPYLRVYFIETMAEKFWGMDSDDLVDRIAALAKAWNCTQVDSDQRESFFLSSAIHKRGLSFTERTWTASSKPQGVERVRRWLLEGCLVLPEHDRMRRELLAFEERITPSGQFTFGARGKTHDDHVALLVTAALAELDDALVKWADGPWRSRPATGITHDAFSNRSDGGSRYGSGREIESPRHGEAREWPDVWTPRQPPGDWE